MLLLMALLPVAVAVIGGAVAIGEVGSVVGTLGPWDAVAESGRRLADEAVRAAPEDPAVVGAAEAHRSALSRSLQRSRLWSLVSERIRALLPLAAVATILVLGGIALVAARWVARSMARPVRELVEWTGRIARGEPLPDPSPGRRPVRELAELRTALRTMADGLEEARRVEVEGARLRAWTEMARRVAHELKNPLTPMRMAAATLARKEDPDTAGAASVLLEEIGRLDRMARTFSQFGRMPEGPRSDVDLVELAEEVARRHDREALPVRVRAPADGVPPVVGHYEVLARAVDNLVVNAVEAADESGSEDGVEIAVRGGDDVELLVRDRGPGIPEELLGSIWMPDVTTRSRGTGLGLAMVRQAAEAHGGRTVAANRAGGGAEVGFRLPLDVEPPEVSSGEAPWRS